MYFAAIMAGYRIFCKKSFMLDLILILLLLYLVYVFLDLQSKQDHAVFPKSKSRKSKDVIWNMLDVQHKLIDHRPSTCINAKYEKIRKASLVSYFNNFQFYDLKVALSSALHKNENYVGELIIVDDGSNEQVVTEDAGDYFGDLHVTVRLLRNEVQMGVAKSLFKALQEVRYEEVVIFDPLVVCGMGWLPPLLDEVIKNPKTIAVPHFDQVSNVASWKYERVEEEYVASVLWNLQTVLIKSNVSSNQASPSMRPDLFAVKLSFLNSIGSIDQGFGYGGGEALELAMRTWCCGGSITMVKCSKVAIANFHNSVKIFSGINLRRIVGLWFQGNPKIFLPLSKSFQPLGHEIDSLSQRKKLFHSLNCKSADWYFEEVLKKQSNLDAHVARVGRLRANSGSCAEVSPDSRVGMLSCESNMKEENTFQLTLHKQLLVLGKCLTAMPNSYVAMQTCEETQNQKWEFTDKHELFNLGAASCATHVTDPDQPTSLRQILMVQNCVQEHKENEIFKQWTFIPV